MPKFIFVVFFCGVAVAFAATEDLNKDDKLRAKENLQVEDDSEHLPRRFESKITAMVECVRQKIKKGIPIIGSLDPLKLKILPLPLRNNFLSGFMLLTNLNLQGLGDFDQTKGSFNINTLRFGLHFDKVQLTTKYRGEMALLRLMDLYGRGALNIAFNNFDIDVVMKVALSTTMRIKELNLNIRLPTTDVVVTGLFNDEFMSDIISRQMTETFTTLAAEEHERFNKVANTAVWSLVEKTINPILEDLSISDIIAIITGGGGGGINCEPAFNKIVEITRSFLIEALGIDTDAIYATDNYNQSDITLQKLNK